MPLPRNPRPAWLAAILAGVRDGSFDGAGGRAARGGEPEATKGWFCL